MLSFKWWLLFAGLAFSAKLQATPPLTTISDTLYNADGTLFNGVLTITWPAFEASDTSNVAAGTLTVQVTNGVLYVQLVPTTNANTGAVYTVSFASLGVVEFTETWAVPPSTIPLRVRDVLVPNGTVSGSGPTVVTIISINDVTGLLAALNLRALIGTTFAPSRTAIIDATGAIDGASGTLSDCMHVDGTSGPCGTTGSGSGSATFVDAETPGGTINGTNASFTLVNAPDPPASLALFRNGLLQEQNGDYTLASNVITFETGAVPQPGDILVAYYRLAVSIPGVGFVDQETPTGAINGVNAAFTLSQTPSPSASLTVFLNGVLQTSGVDYTASGTTVTFFTASIPQSGDILLCSFRIAE
jgi:hypothetical protein